MKFECGKCKKTFNFNNAKLPDKAFSFNCTQCGERNWVTREEIVDAKCEARSSGTNGGFANSSGKPKTTQAVLNSVPKIDPAKLKKPVVKLVGLLARLSHRSELDWLFSITKFAAVFSIAALMGAIAFGGFAYYQISGQTEVTYREVEHSLYLKKDPTISIQSAVPDLQLPSRMTKHLGDEHREMFVDWINALEDHEKADFVDNLDKIMIQAQKLEPEHLHNFINEYQRLKYHRSVRKPLAPFLVKTGIILLLVAMLALLGLFCLIILQLNWQKTVLAPAGAEPPAAQKVRPPLFKKPRVRDTGSLRV